METLLSLYSDFLLAVPVFTGMFDALFAKVLPMHQRGSAHAPIQSDNGAAVAELVSQSAFSSLMLIAGFTNLLQLSQSFSELAGYSSHECSYILSNCSYAVRISDLIEKVDMLEMKEFEWGTSSVWAMEHVPAGKVVEGDTVSFKNTTCTTPDGRRLVRGMYVLPPLCAPFIHCFTCVSQ